MGLLSFLYDSKGMEHDSKGMEYDWMAWSMPTQASFGGELRLGFPACQRLLAAPVSPGGPCATSAPVHSACLTCADRYAAPEQREQQGQQEAEQAQPQDAQRHQAQGGGGACGGSGQQQEAEGSEEEGEEEFHDALSSLGEAFQLMGGRRATLCVSSEVRQQGLLM